MGQYKGRKVKLTRAMEGYNKGDIGTITQDEKLEMYQQGVIEVTMEDGDTVTPWAPWDGRAQCTWVEESYRIEDIKGKRIAVECVDKQEYDTVMRILDENSIRWDRQQKATEYTPDNITWPHGISLFRPTRIGHCRIQWYKDEEYQIISANQLITDNTDNNMEQNKEVLEKIQKMEQELKELKESFNKPVYKVGDWIVPVIDTTVSYPLGRTKRKQGTAYQVDSVRYNSIHKTNVIDTKGVGPGHLKVEDIRPATPDEIKKAQEPQSYTLPIGTGTHTVCVEKGKITGPESKDIDIADINRLVATMDGGAKAISGWAISVAEIKVGCCDHISLKQLQDIASAYQKLNS